MDERRTFVDVPRRFEHKCVIDGGGLDGDDYKNPVLEHEPLKHSSLVDGCAQEDKSAFTDVPSSALPLWCSI